MIHLMWLFMLLCMPTVGWAATYWVNPSSSGQNCVNSASDPGVGSSSQTIDQGQGCLSAGDTLMVKAGTYGFGNMSLTKGGTSDGNRVTYRSEVPLGAILQGDGNVNAATALHIANPWVLFEGFKLYRQGLSLAGTDNVRVKDVEVDHAHQGIAFSTTSSGLEFLNVNVHHSGYYDYPTLYTSCNETLPGLYGGDCHGMYSEGTNILIDGGQFHHNHQYGLHLYTTPGVYTVRNARFYNNGACGIGYFFGSAAGTMYNNLVYDNGGGICNHGSNRTIYHNTVYQNSGDGIRIGPEGSANTVGNNIAYNNGSNVTLDGGATTFKNICNSTGGGCALSGNPAFVNAPSKDFHLQSGSPVINQGNDVLASVPKDFEGANRDSTPDLGAYQFGGVIEPPAPVGNLVKLEFEQGSGTTANDTSNNPTNHPCALNSAGWASGIIGTFSLDANGARSCTITGTADLRPTGVMSVSLWLNTTQTVDTGGLVGMSSNAWRLKHDSGVVYFSINNDSVSVSAPASIANGTNRHIYVGKDSLGLRIWIDKVQVAFTPTTAPISYSGTENLRLAVRSTTDEAFFVGRFDQFNYFDTEPTQLAADNLFGEFQPVPGVSGINVRWRADNSGQTQVGTQNTSTTWDLTQNVGIEWDITNASGSGVTKHFTLYCSKNGGSYTELTKTLGAFGAVIGDSPNVNMGDSVAVPASQGFTPVSGRVVVDTINTSLTTTLPNGGITTWRWVVGFGSPAVVNDTFRCKPYVENTPSADTTLDHYFDDNNASIPLLTLFQTPAPGSGGSILGGVHAGGTSK